MNYNTGLLQGIPTLQASIEAQLKKGFRTFISLLAATKKNIQPTPIAPIPSEKRNYFLEKYQQLLIAGKTGNVQVVKIVRLNDECKDHNNAIYLSFKMVTEEGTRMYTAAAIAPREHIPIPNAVIPVYYNPLDFSVIVLL